MKRLDSNQMATLAEEALQMSRSEEVIDLVKKVTEL